MERGGASRPTSIYSQASSSSCCPVDEGKREIRGLMDSFISDLKRTVLDAFPDDLEAAHANHPTAPPARSGSSSTDTEMTQPVVGAYAANPATGATALDENYEHKGIWCDCCTKQVVGIRHKCLDCYNFDLCNPCMTTGDIQSTHADMPHTFQAIHPPQSKPIPAPSRAATSGGSRTPATPQCLCSVLPRPLGCHICNPRLPKHKRSSRALTYKCDSCQKTITSTRHKCMACPDFDLCESCYSAGFPISEHSPVHRFMHIEDPIRIITAPAFSQESVSPLCAGCPHDGPRYKCDSCGAVDLCMDCLGPVERATVEHAAFHVEQGWDHPVRFVPYNQEPKAPSSAPAVPARPTLVVHSANCDACDETIFGIRHKCTVCHDLDLCDSCYSSRAEPSEHMHEHEMLHLDRPMKIVTHVVESDENAASRARVVSISSASTATPNALHDAWCDGCTERIRGVRHKCLDCTDFDLCDGCVLDYEHFDGQHEFYALAEPGEVVVRDVGQKDPVRPRGRANYVPIPPPVPAPPAAPEPPRTPSQRPPRPARPSHPAQPAQHSAECDMCSSRIRGVRYKCISCPDYDVCASCFSISEEVHPGHSFTKVYKQGDVVIRKSTQAAFRHHARCDACQAQIMGVRYKCIHPACPDFDICERCEAMPIPVHPSTHVLIKLRNHVSHYDGLKTVLGFAVRGQVPQPETVPAPTPVVRIPSPQVQTPQGVRILPMPALGLTIEPATAMDVFHTPAPSPVVPLSTLGCTIVPHTTIVASIPHSPAPEVMPSLPRVISAPASPPTIPSPPPIPASLLPLVFGSEKALSDSWSAASSSAKLDEHVMHHSDMYKPSYEAPAAAAVAPSVVEEPAQPTVQVNDTEDRLEATLARLRKWKEERAQRMHEASHTPAQVEAPAGLSTPTTRSVTVDEEYDPEAPQMTLITQSRPVSFPSVSVQEPEAEDVAEPVEVAESVASPLLVSVSEHEGNDVPDLPSLVPSYPYVSSLLPAPSSVASESPRFKSPSSVASSASVVSVRSVDTTVLSAAFVEDKSIVDGQIVSGGAEFTKCWRMCNDGPNAWPKGTTISFVGGHSMLIQSDMVHWTIAGDFTPGSEIDVEVEMKAPEEPGRYVSYWRLKTPMGEAFGARVWCDIVVAEMERAGSAGSSEISASSIIVPTRAPSMSAGSVSLTMRSVPSTIHTASVADTTDAESIGSLDSDDSAVWDEVRRQAEGLSARSVGGDGFEVVYDSD